MTTLKQTLKRSIGRHWALLVRIRRSKLLRGLAAMPSAPLKLWRQKRNGQYFPVIVSGEMGMGALLIHVLRLLRHADRHGLTPIIRVHNPLYATSAEPDLLEAYLGFKCPEASHPLQFHRLSSEADYAVFGVELALDIAQAHQTFRRYLSFSEVILSQCRQVLEQNRWDFAVAIHYRGTDKIYEIPKAPAAQMIAECGRVLSSIGTDCAFLATDEPEFAGAITAAYPGVRFLSFEYEAQLERGTPRHFSVLSPSKKAIEALVNLRLLSQSRYLVRTPSLLSAVSCLLNPEIHVNTIARSSQMREFPERQILEMQRSTAVTR